MTLLSLAKLLCFFCCFFFSHRSPIFSWFPDLWFFYPGLQWSSFLLWLMLNSTFHMFDRKTNPRPRCQCLPRWSSLDSTSPTQSHPPHPPLPPTKLNLLYYCSEIVSFNLVINCRIVLRRKRLASTASLQRSHLQPVHARTCSQQTQTRVLANVSKTLSAAHSTSASDPQLFIYCPWWSDEPIVSEWMRLGV